MNPENKWIKNRLKFIGFYVKAFEIASYFSKRAAEN